MTEQRVKELLNKKKDVIENLNQLHEEMKILLDEIHQCHKLINQIELEIYHGKDN